MRLVFFFVSEGGAPTKEIPSWNPKAKAQSKYLDGRLGTEGLFWMFTKMKKEKIIYDILIIIESAKGCGRFELDGNLGFIVPHVSCVEPLLKKNDILFIRGGFRGWYDWLKSRKGQNWLLLYAANTGRQSWDWWDIVFHDLSDIIKPQMDKAGRFWFPFRKPTNEEVFYPMLRKRTYDFCFGASYIHDKKGQWRAIRALEEHCKIYPRMPLPHCIMPGSVRSGTQTNPAIPIATNFNVEMPGMVKREELNIILNSSKYFVHLGNSGQNDRGPIEAMRCGCMLVIGSPKYHSPYVYGDYKTCFIPEDRSNFKKLAMDFHSLLENYDAEDKQLVLNRYTKTMSINKILQDMRVLFKVLTESKPSKEAFIRSYCL